MKLKNEGSFFFAFLFFITAALFIIYCPTFNHVSYFDGKQLDYLFERKDLSSFKEAWRFTDFSLVTQHGKGDEALYRPLLFLWIAALVRFFPYHYIAWNLIQFTLHLSATYFLFLLLRALNKGIIAYGAVLFFAFLAINLHIIENVHLGGYIIAYNLFLIALLLTRKIISPAASGRTDRDLYALAFVIGVAVFFYEVMLAAALVIFIFILVQRHRQKAPLSIKAKILFLLPVLLYLIAYLNHIHAAPRLDYAPRSSGATYCLTTAENFLGLIPCVLGTFRQRIHEIFLFNPMELIPYFKWRILIPSLLIFLFIKESLTWTHLKKKLLWLSMLAGILLVYLLISCFGRGENTSFYYCYFFALVLTLLFYSFFDWTRLSGFKKSILLLIFAIFTCYQSGMILSNIPVARDKPRENYYSFLSRFIEQHKNEPDFSFMIQNPDPESDPPTPFRRGYEDETNAPLDIQNPSQIIYSKFYRQERPKYSLIWDPKALLFTLSSKNEPS